MDSWCPGLGPVTLPLLMAPKDSWKVWQGAALPACLPLCQVNKAPTWLLASLHLCGFLIPHCSPACCFWFLLSSLGGTECLRAWGATALPPVALAGWGRGTSRARQHVVAQGTKVRSSFPGQCFIVRSISTIALNLSLANPVHGAAITYGKTRSPES